MNEQLELLTAPAEWRIDKRTREVGLQAIAEARALLADGEHLDNTPLAA